MSVGHGFKYRPLSGVYKNHFNSHQALLMTLNSPATFSFLRTYLFGFSRCYWPLMAPHHTNKLHGPRPTPPEPRPKAREIPVRPANSRGGEGEYLDRWTPRVDTSHYRRVNLYRKRKHTVAQHRENRRQRHQNGPSTSTVGAGGSASAPRTTPSPQPSDSLSVPDLASKLQDELDSYDDKIKSLQAGQWPTTPEPRSKAIRVKGSQFCEQRAAEMKQWSFAEGVLYGKQSVTLRDSDSIHSHERYRHGIIFSAPMHNASTSDQRWVSTNDPYQTATPFGIVHSKYRKMLVIKRFGEHCLCLPIYSHHNQGHSGKEFANEYVSIRDRHDPRPEPPEGIYGSLFAEAAPGFGRLVVVGKSSIKLTEVTSHRYDVPATIEGRLPTNELRKCRRLQYYLN